MDYGQTRSEQQRNIHRIRFYEPKIDDMWFRQLLLADPETMSYNRAWGGTIHFSKDKWK